MRIAAVFGLLGALLIGRLTAEPNGEMTEETAATNAIPTREQRPETGQSEAEAPDEDATSASEARSIRDPFWPVGYVPPPPEAEGMSAEQQAERERERLAAMIRWPRLTLKGVTRAGDRFMGIVDRVGLVEPGQRISLRSGNLIYVWEIESVDETGLRYRRIEALPVENAK